MHDLYGCIAAEYCRNVKTPTAGASTRTTIFRVPRSTWRKQWFRALRHFGPVPSETRLFFKHRRRKKPTPDPQRRAYSIWSRSITLAQV